MTDLAFAFSPCPNDAFAFHALAHGLVETDLRVRATLLDIEELNQSALRGKFALSKVSFGVLPRLGDRYRLLRSGAALGFGCGPLVVAKTPQTLGNAARAKIAIPGRDTTAYLLLRLAAGEPGNAIEMRYDRILGAVETGAVDAGLIIHESRFTYGSHGLVKVADLGDWWEKETALPIPLGAIVARADLGDDTIAAAERAVRASVEYAFAHPEASRDYVRANAQEMDDEVCAKHIALYVNSYTIDLGDEGLRAVEALMGRSRKAAPSP